MRNLFRLLLSILKQPELFADLASAIARTESGETFHLDGSYHAGCRRIWINIDGEVETGIYADPAFCC